MKKMFGEIYWESAPSHENKGFTQADIRFTTNYGALYATVLATPTQTITLKYLSVSKIKIKRIALLGYDGSIQFEQTEEGTIISLPEDINLKHAWVFKISS